MTSGMYTLAKNMRAPGNKYNHNNQFQSQHASHLEIWSRSASADSKALPRLLRRYCVAPKSAALLTSEFAKNLRWDTPKAKQPCTRISFRATHCWLSIATCGKYWSMRPSRQTWVICIIHICYIPTLTTCLCDNIRLVPMARQHQSNISNFGSNSNLCMTEMFIHTRYRSLYSPQAEGGHVEIEHPQKSILNFNAALLFEIEIVHEEMASIMAIWKLGETGRLHVMCLPQSETAKVT